ncbi:MAG: protein translocase SEC61 complex subunit gamma [Nanoarchaeota archaeon]|nr:protein translocase SEC61 complex subunit gamma [Nanoarchaeota archaeon]MBU1028354.1 protein translocase SEC61 complex subunit gamma [Nanoarchaeota archaeon]
MTILLKSKSFLLKCKRVWHILKKPNKKEYEQVSKISSIGIAILGLLGFLISLIMKIFV